MDKILIFQILYIIGISTESITGSISAIKNNMDIFGIITIATITALGGGTIRDILLGCYPLTWITYPEYIVITIFAAVITIFVQQIIKLQRLFIVLDAIGLVTFAYIGSDIGYKISIIEIQNIYFNIIGSVVISIIMAIVTGVSGGILRDILCNTMPIVFTNELYAIIAALVGILHVLSIQLKIDNIIAALAILFFSLVLRLISVYKNLNLPKVKKYF